MSFIAVENQKQAFSKLAVLGFFSLLFVYLVSITVYTHVQVERVYKSNPIFEAKNTTFLEKV